MNLSRYIISLKMQSMCDEYYYKNIYVDCLSMFCFKNYFIYVYVFDLVKSLYICKLIMDQIFDLIFDFCILFDFLLKQFYQYNGIGY